MLEKFLQKALIGATLLASAPAFADAPNPKLEQRIVLAQNDCPPYIPDCNRGKSGGYGQQPPGAQVYYPASRPVTSEPRPLYLSPAQSPQYAQPTPVATTSRGCGNICTVIGALVAAGCAGMLIALEVKLPGLKREWDADCRYVESLGGHCGSGPGHRASILFGIGAASGLGLMIYGFMSK